MRPRTIVRSLSALLAVAACVDSTGPEATPQITDPSSFVGQVTRAEYEGVNGPAGAYAQYDVWLVVAPGTSANAGVVVPVRVPVYSRRGSTATTPFGRVNSRLQNTQSACADFKDGHLRKRPPSRHPEVREGGLRVV